VTWTLLTALYWSSLDADLTTKGENENVTIVQNNTARDDDGHVQATGRQSATVSRGRGVYEGDDRGLRVYEDDDDFDDPTVGLLGARN
jgi:hypothetical protein